MYVNGPVGDVGLRGVVHMPSLRSSLIPIEFWANGGCYPSPVARDGICGFASRKSIFGINKSKTVLDNQHPGEYIAGIRTHKGVDFVRSRHACKGQSLG